ncbi:MAG: PilN domain-containing protein [Thermoanaerobaculia bacterium]
MIRINLLAEGKKPVVTKKKQATEGGLKAILQSENLSFYVLVLVALIGLVVLGGRYGLLESRISTLREEVETFQKEVDELEPIIREVEEFKAKKIELERKVQVINQLKANQRGPVRIMGYVSRAVPELLWLNRMQVGSQRITISGEAFNTNAVANFMENLDRFPEFREPVLRDTSQRGGVYTFTLSFNYEFPVEVEEPAPAG